MNLEEIKNRIDIVDVVNRYVKLKKIGRYYSGLCPFHRETKPSFYVSPEMQIFKCFGCGVGGDVIKFVSQIENLSYAQAILKIKQDYGLDVDFDINRNNDYLSQENKIYEINYAALKFFRQELKKNKEVWNYLLKRGLEEKTINFFELGFSPGGTLLRDYLYSQDYSYDLIKKAGLIDNKNFDRFQSRIIFPLRSEKGKLVGFTGRLFNDSLPGPKYLNTPETLVFKKSDFLYGLYFSKDWILSEKKVIIVEGQFDFILAWQNNIKNVVAVSGSSLTEEHLRKLKRFSRVLVFAFDNDEAGFKASLRANIIARSLEFNTFKLIYHGKDLAEFFEKNSANNLNLKNNLQEVKFEDYLLNYLLTNFEDKKFILDIFLPQIANLSSYEIDFYLNKLSENLNLSKNLLEGDLIKKYDKLKYTDLLNQKNEDDLILSQKNTLEEKFSLKFISLVYTLNNISDKELTVADYLREDFKDLFYRLIEKKLSNEEFDYFEMAKNFYISNKINLNKELEKTTKNLKIIFYKKKLASLNENLKLANDQESVKILEEIKNTINNLRLLNKNG